MTRQPERVRDAARIRRLQDRIGQLEKALPGGTRILVGFEHAVATAVAALLAYLPVQALGFQQGFWGAITAISVTQAEYRASRSTARDQFMGAAIGGVMGVASVAALGQHLGSYIVAVLVSVTSCWVLNVPSASRLAGVTATIVVIVPHQGSPERVMASRIGEVAWGVTVALGVVWVIGRLGWLASPAEPPVTAAKDKPEAG